MKQVIEVKFLPPCDRHGSRLKAISLSLHITRPYDYSKSVEENYEFIASEMLKILNWGNVELISGRTNSGLVIFIPVNKE